jgi:predicted nucleic acid-binding protein
LAGSAGVSVPEPVPEYIIDTSVALKWLLEREEGDLIKARDLRNACVEGRCSLRAPELLVIELANALTTGHRHTAHKVSEALDAIRKLDLRLEAVRWSTLGSAVALASSYGVTVYDSYFWALAVESGRLLVTADEAFLRRAGGHPSVVSLRRLRLPA